MTLHEATSTSHGTAFRVRERLYKRRVPPPGYADVVDVRAVESNTAANRARIRCVAQVVVPNGGASHWLRDELKVFYFDGLEGVVLIPNALNVPGQRHYIHRALSQYARAPNVSNLDAHWQVPRGRGENDMDDDSSLWELWLAERRLARAEQVSSSSRILVQPRDIERVMMADSNDNGDDYAHASATTLPGITPLKHDQPLPPSALMRRLRWTTLGHRYDWHTKQYVELDKAVGMPDDLSILACTLVHAAGPHLSCRVRAVGAGRDMEGEDGEEYRRRRKAAGKTLRHVLRVDDDNVDYDMNDAARDRPEQQEHTLGYTKRYCPQAGIVNFYQIRDTLTAHVDRSELNMEAPLVSLSLGHDCVFLVGGSTRDTEPVAFWLRSGDVLILSGEGRRAFHGVPRIVHAHGVDELFGERETSDDEITAEEWDACHDFLASGARININVRQLFFEDGNTDVDVADEVRDPSRVVRGR